MVRLDLKRLESLMLNSFEHNKSIQSLESGHDEGRKSFLDLPSLRHSLDSAKAENDGKTCSIINIIACGTELRERLEDSEQFVLGTSETVNEKLEEI